MKKTQRTILIVALFVVLGTLVQPIAPAKEQSEAAKRNEAFKKTENVEGRVKSFESPNRPVVKKQKEIVAACAVTPGMAVADIGAGTGLYTRVFAEKVGDKGTVYAVEISKPFLAHIEKTCKDKKIENIKCVESTDKTTGLEKGSVDLVFVCDTYHHFEFPEVMLAAIAESLRAGGRLVVVDRNKKGHSPLTPEMLKTQADKVGLKLVTEHPEMTTQHYLMIFSKK